METVRSRRSDVRSQHRRIAILGMGVAILLVGSGCEDSFRPSAEVDHQPLAFRHLDTPGMRVSYPQSHVVESAYEWQELWESHAEGSVPTVDFSRYVLAVVFWGAHSGCRDLVEGIESVVERSGQIEVEVGPMPELGECDAVNYPHDIVEIPRSELTVVFVGEVPL